MSLLDLPPSLLDTLASSLDARTAKSLALAHSHLTESAEANLWHTLSLPLRSTSPIVADSLREQGYDVADPFERDHLGASMRYISALLRPSVSWWAQQSLVSTDKSHPSATPTDPTILSRPDPAFITPTTTPSPSRRITHIRHLIIHLHHAYHHPELDLDSTNWSSIFGHPFQSSWALDDPDTLAIARHHLATQRQLENPLDLPSTSALRSTFESFPVLPAVHKLTVTVYESYHSFLPFLLRLTPNLREITIIPHQLLVESPLHFDPLDYSTWPKLPYLRSITFDPMLPCFNDLSTYLIEGTRYLEDLQMLEQRCGAVTRGRTRRSSTGDGGLSSEEGRMVRALSRCRGLKSASVPRGVREGLERERETKYRSENGPMGRRSCSVTKGHW